MECQAPAARETFVSANEDACQSLQEPNQLGSSRSVIGSSRSLIAIASGLSHRGTALAAQRSASHRRQTTGQRGQVLLVKAATAAVKPVPYPSQLVFLRRDLAEFNPHYDDFQ